MIFSHGYQTTRRKSMDGGEVGITCGCVFLWLIIRNIIITCIVSFFLSHLVPQVQYSPIVLFIICLLGDIFVW